MRHFDFRFAAPATFDTNLDYFSSGKVMHFRAYLIQVTIQADNFRMKYKKNPHIRTQNFRGQAEQVLIF